MSKQPHEMPKSIRRVERGVYEVRGTELRIVQGDDGKWRVEGHSDDLGSFASRGIALAKLDELKLVPVVPAEQPVQPDGEQGPAPTVTDPTDASGADGANGGTDRHRPRKPRQRKVAAKV